MSEKRQGRRSGLYARIAVGSPPVSWNPSSTKVGDDLDGPTELRHHLSVCLRGYEGMAPGMDRDVIAVAKRLEEDLGVRLDVGPDVEVSRLLIILLQEVVESWAVVGRTLQGWTGKEAAGKSAM